MVQGEERLVFIWSEADDDVWGKSRKTYRNKAQGQVKYGDDGEDEDIVVQLCRLLRLPDRCNHKHLFQEAGSVWSVMHSELVCNTSCGKWAE